MPIVADRPLFEQFVTDTADHYVDTDAELGLNEREARRVRNAYRRAFLAFEANHPGCLAEYAEIAGLKGAHAEHANVLAQRLAERPSARRIHDREDELAWAQIRDAEERGTPTDRRVCEPTATVEEKGRGASNVTMPLPTIDGQGLTEVEYRRVTGARNRARTAYRQDCPTADLTEVEAVARKAATDELRRVLKGRPPYRVIRASQVARKWIAFDNTDAPNDHSGSFIGHNPDGF